MQQRRLLHFGNKLRQFFQSFCRRSQIDFFGLFNQRIDNITLPPLGDFVSNHSIRPLGIVFGHVHRSNGRAPWRHFINHRKIQIAVNRHGQRSGNRRRRHDQRVGPLALCHQLQALQNAKPMLFIDNDQAEIPKLRFVFNQNMRSNDDIDFTRRQAPEEFLLFGRLYTAPNNANGVIQRSQDPPGIPVMLFGENFGRRHDGRLIPVRHGNDDRFKSDNGLAASNVSLHETVHWILRLQVIHNLLQDAFLRGGGMKRKNLTHLTSNRVVGFKSDSADAMRLLSPQCENQFEQKELFEDHPTVIRRLAPIQRGNIVFLQWKMNAIQASPNIRESVGRTNLRRQWIIDHLFKIRNRRRYDSTQLPACQTANFFIDGDRSADIQRRRRQDFFGVCRRFNQFKFRIEKHEIPVAVIEVHAAVHHHFFAGSKRPALMDVSAVKPFGVNETRAIGENGVEDAPAGTGLYHAALVDARMNGRILPGMQRIQSNEIGSILVGLRNMAEQVPDGSNSTRHRAGKSGGGRRP